MSTFYGIHAEPPVILPAHLILVEVLIGEGSKCVVSISLLEFTCQMFWFNQTVLPSLVEHELLFSHVPEFFKLLINEPHQHETSSLFLTLNTKDLIFKKLAISSLNVVGGQCHGHSVTLFTEWKVQLIQYHFHANDFNSLTIMESLEDDTNENPNHGSSERSYRQFVHKK